jgi:hypothetical protein
MTASILLASGGLFVIAWVIALAGCFAPISIIALVVSYVRSDVPGAPRFHRVAAFIAAGANLVLFGTGAGSLILASGFQGAWGDLALLLLLPLATILVVIAPRLRRRRKRLRTASSAAPGVD